MASDIPGGQQAADVALAAFDVAGYAAARNEVWPVARRGASGLSPYIRHGLLSLRRVWEHVGSGPATDVERFRDELLWQEYSRHLYARVGRATRRSLRYSVAEHGPPGGNPWVSEARCLDQAWGELQVRGWLPNQMRMWLASHWNVRSGMGWRDGEDLFFRYLLDGSRAANRTGWQWTVGALTGKPYGFSRWQVEKRAPGMCLECPLASACPIEQWPDEQSVSARTAIDPRLRRITDVADVTGPLQVSMVSTGTAPEAVWITAESLSDADPALAGHPDLPAVFVFDEPLLKRLRLSPLRLVFLAETLADLNRRRPVEVLIGDPAVEIGDRPVAATFAPVPGWRDRASRMRVVQTHPWPWLVVPDNGPATSFTAWVRGNGGVRKLVGRR
ncbi:MAG TPA: deoxyribodipyrimidine photolyase [Actinobacteria bacterium]|nr:deoxyribodipyrimidine photolyase [Actinomycetota bacterium]